MAESSIVTRKTVRRKVISSSSSSDLADSSSANVKVIRTTKVIEGGDLGDDDIRITKANRTYQVYRGMSPTTSNRLEIRMRELEDSLEMEREHRMRAEREASELSFQLDSLTERLEEAEGISSTQSEISRKRDAEVIKIKKDIEVITMQAESNEMSLRKRHNEAVADLSEQVEALQRGKGKAEKEKQTLIIEVDNALTQCDAANKARAHAESKADSLEDQLRRLKAQVDELTRQNQDLSGLKARLTQENFDLQRQIQELDSSHATLAKAKAALQHALDDAKSKLDDESRMRSQLTVQITNLQVDCDNANARADEECDNANQARAMLSKAQTDFQALKSKYDKDLMAKTEELEDMRRRLQARIAELEDLAEQARVRASKLEKEKNRLSIEVRELTVELENSQANAADLAKRLKQAEGLNADLSRRVEDMTHELQVAHGDNQRLAAELARLKVQYGDLQDKLDAANRENKNLSDALRDANSANKDLNRQVNELTSIRIQLEGERDSLAGELADTRDAYKDAQAKLDSANAALAQLRSDMEARLREKDDEIENIRKSSARALDELQRTLIEIETKYKAELSRLKKKYETEIREYEIQIETLNRCNAELNKANKSMGARLKELEMALDDERRAGEEARQAVTVLERKRIALATELEDVRTLLETSERARKNADNELHDASVRINELHISLTSVTQDKRRMEADISAMQADLDEALNARRAADDRADRLQAENNRLNEDLRGEQENYRNAESLRKQLEVEIREITVRLEEAEQFAQREGKRMVAKLTARLRDLESELELEQRRSREVAAANRKFERQLAEIRVQADEDHRVRAELHDQVNTLTIRIKSLRRQLEEAEEVVTITMNKYRKAQGMIEEAEHRAETAERTMTVRGGTGRNRSMSVTREITRVVRV